MSFTTVVDVATLAAQLRAPDWLIIDCRFELGKPLAGEAAYAEGHIAGARYAHLDRDLADPVGPNTGRHPLPDPAVFAAKAAAWGVGPDTQVIVYDQGNSFYAARAWWVFRWLGHRRVAVLDGGLAAWRAAGHELSTVAPPVAAAHGQTANEKTARFAAMPDASKVVDVLEVRRSLGATERTLVDARGADRYAGDNETIDPVGGHVPGAINHHYARNYQPDGRLKDADTLRREWLATLNGRQPEAMIAMCGSGVSACVNLLALEHAGLAGARLFPGSWSEWVRDPSRPVARGSQP